ncbi:UNVERIFIED_CONTAM: hypothetical protein Slati_2989200 [Sesamum latifolium]|uniref:Uncharacterized protein n=1 Tax=Sesamum latifolium TaxID=2727402 RepID=A0AAW2VGQ8_9LAMI
MVKKGLKKGPAVQYRHSSGRTVKQPATHAVGSSASMHAHAHAGRPIRSSHRSATPSTSKRASEPATCESANNKYPSSVPSPSKQQTASTRPASHRPASSG